jgi:hypothetical protein
MPQAGSTALKSLSSEATAWYVEPPKTSALTMWMQLGSSASGSCDSVLISHQPQRPSQAGKHSRQRLSSRQPHGTQRLY